MGSGYGLPSFCAAWVQLASPLSLPVLELVSCGVTPRRERTPNMQDSAAGSLTPWGPWDPTTLTFITSP